MSDLIKFGKEITINEGAAMTKRYRDSGQSPIATVFGADILNKILSEPNVHGIRFYYGKDANNNPNLVLVGVDQQGNDLINGTIADHGKLDPPITSNLNALNSNGI